MDRKYFKLIILPCIFLFIFYLAPLFSIFLNAIKRNESINIGHRFYKIFLQSTIISLIATFFVIIFAIFASYVLKKINIRFNNILLTIITIPFILPTVIVGIIFNLLFQSIIKNFDNTNSIFLISISIIYAFVFFNFGFATKNIYTQWSLLNEDEEIASQTLMANEIKTFFLITIPKLKNTIISTSILVFFLCWSSYGTVLILGHNKVSTIETEIYYQAVSLYNIKTASIISIIQIIFICILLFFIKINKIKYADKKKYIQKDYRSLFFKIFVKVIFTIIYLLIILPIIILVIDSLMPNGQFSFINYKQLFSNELYSSFYYSIKTAIFAMILSLTIALPISYYLVNNIRIKKNTVFNKIIEILFLLPMGTSAVIIGLGFLIFFFNPFYIHYDFRTSSFIIPIAQSIVIIPFIVRMLMPSLEQINKQQTNSALLLGANPLKIFFSIELLQIKNALLSSICYSFIMSIGEFGATNFLARDNTKTLSVLLYDYLNKPTVNSYNKAESLSVVIMCFITILVLITNISLKDKSKKINVLC